MIGTEKILDYFISEVIRETEQEIIEDKMKQQKCRYQYRKDRENISIEQKNIDLKILVKGKEVIFCDPFTILFYYDEEGVIKYVISKCMESDTYSKDKGLELCTLKALREMTQEKIDKF